MTEKHSLTPRLVFGFSFLFWLSSVTSLYIISWYLGVPDFLFHEKTDSFLIVSHVVGSAILIFFMARLIIGKAIQHRVEFSLITLLVLVEMHCLFGFRSFTTPHPSSPFSPFMMFFFFMAIPNMLTVFPITYIIHKALLILAEGGYSMITRKNKNE